ALVGRGALLKAAEDLSSCGRPTTLGHRTLSGQRRTPAPYSILPCRYSQAATSRLTARSTSSSLVYQPTLSRTVPRAISGRKPMAASVADRWAEPEWHAAPVEAHSSGQRPSSSAAFTCGKFTESVFGRRSAPRPL